MTSDLGEFEAHLLHGAQEMPELKQWQVQGEGEVAVLACVYGLPVLPRSGVSGCSESYSSWV